MIGFKVDQAKGFFFDSPKVVAAVDKAERANLSKAGAAVRREAQRSIQIREGSAPASAPPHGHVSGTRTRTSKSTGRVRVQPVSLLREFIYFVWDAISRSVIVGPAKLNGRVSGTALEALEYGGETEAKFVEKGAIVEKTIQIEAHPFMRPALEAQKAQAAAVWSNSVKG